MSKPNQIKKKSKYKRVKKSGTRMNLSRRRSTRKDGPIRESKIGNRKREKEKQNRKRKAIQ